ncbi:MULTISPECIES: COG4315 family predicted lipoprotein [Burkholderia]|uniref:COG4315 family predicted lipoprotein n=1 Tax=Burkholderia TaxID=32008 RepID=UPI00158C1021|nr:MULTISPECIES: ATP-binding protein [Burkholderia]MDN7682804.1 ATP-binding protein [Burkholderia cenocepacia]
MHQLKSFPHSIARQSLIVAATAVALNLTGCASHGIGMSSAPLSVKTADGVLTDARGMTLYTFNRDTVAGKSACNGNCAIKWPPLAADGTGKAVGDYTVIVRDDGTKQWAYRGKPLYLWSQDKAPGQITGDGFMNVWHTAKP